MRAEMAVLKAIASMSSLTFLMVWWRSRRVASSIVSTRGWRQTAWSRSRKRTTPWICEVCHGFTASSGPMNIS
jgi:hypothetical protein